LPDDAWNLSCGIYFIPGLDFEVAGCPDNEGPDYDFGQGPALFKVKGAGGKPQELVGAGQKSGVYWRSTPTRVPWCGARRRARAASPADCSGARPSTAGASTPRTRTASSRSGSSRTARAPAIGRLERARRRDRSHPLGDPESGL